MALTKAGDQCRGRASNGSDFCPSHGGTRRRPVGARTKLTDAVERTIVEALEKGVPLETAAQAAGIHRATLARWREQGEADLEANKPDTVHARFCDAVTRAISAGEEALVSTVKRHAGEDWRAAAFLLERRFPARYGKRLELAGEVNTPPPAVIVPESDEVRTAIGRVLERAGAVEAPAKKGRK